MEIVVHSKNSVSSKIPWEIVWFQQEFQTQECDVKKIQLDLQCRIKNPTATPPKNLWLLRLTPRESETDSTTATLLKTVRYYFFRRTFFTTWRTVCEKEHCFGFRNTSFLTSPQCSLSYRQSNGADSNNRSKMPTYNRLKLFNSFQKYRIFSNISRFWIYDEVEFSPKTRNYLWLKYKLSLQTSVTPRLLYDVIKTSTETGSN